MARGWESKSVEQQQAESRLPKQKGKQLTAEQLVNQRRKRGLELSRRRVAEELEHASNPRHRAMLEAALADLSQQLQQ